METVMRTIISEEGRLQLIMLRKGDYTLIAKYKMNEEFHEYVVCQNYDETKGVWSNGHYFWNNLDKAIEFMKNYTQEEYVTKDRLCEIATHSLHLLKENELLEDLQDDVNLNSSELDFFGLSEGDEIYTIESGNTLLCNMKIWGISR